MAGHADGADDDNGDTNNNRNTQELLELATASVSRNLYTGNEEAITTTHNKYK